MKQKVFLGILVLLLLIWWWSVFMNFLPNHQYYSTMFATSANRWLLIWGIISAAIPLLYIIYTKVSSLKNILITMTIWLVLYSIAFVSIKDSALNVAWFVILLVNVWIIFGLWLYSIIWRTAIWSRIMEKVFKISTSRWQDMLLSFWLGLGSMMAVVHLLIISHIFYPIFSWILLAFAGLSIRYQRKRSLSGYKNLIEEMVSWFHISSLKDNKRLWIGVVLLWLSIVYFYYGFQLSFIPYSTAWDANHAYMYIPKIRAENHGALWYGQPWWAWGSLWMSYISFFFSVIQPIKSWFRLSPDNIAVSMNFLSWLFVLIFGIWLIKESTEYILSLLWKTKDALISTVWLYTGWMWLLLRVTSGMWAFLVFVDNKTDMGVLAMTILAILAWFIFIRYIHDHKSEVRNPNIIKYIVLWWLFFGLAVAAKPTAFIDVVIFVLFVLALWINSWVALWFWLIVIALLAKMQVLFTAEFMSESAFIPLVVIWLVIVFWSLLYRLKNAIDYKKSLWLAFRTLCIRWVSLVSVVIMLKLPYLVIQSRESWEFDSKKIVNGLLMWRSNTSSMFASISDVSLIEQQNIIDNKVSLPWEMCSLEYLWITEDDLDKGTKEFVGGNWLNEDVGRYVWFWRKEFSQWLWYRLAKTLFSRPWSCYGWNASAKVLCENEENINNFDIAALQKVVSQLSTQSQWYVLLSWALNAEKLQTMIATNTFNPAQMKDEIVSIRQWYQGRSIKARENSLMVPYRYIVPWNAVFNRSLQNLSSYYTDIGFIRWIAILLNLLALVYAIAVRDSKLLGLSVVSVIGWIIRWLIAGGIVRYGIGLIVRSILTMVVFFVSLYARNHDEKDRLLFMVAIILLVLWSSVQLLMNFIRISSQWWWWPFVRYKMWVWTQQVVENTLAQSSELKIPYTWKNVFDLQFSHYNKFIEHVKDRPDEDWVSIAWTYLQYFLHNQHNVGGANIYNLTSDGNTCKSYLRFQRDGWKYLVIDPNILSVVMWEGNESLMYRFFAKRNPVTGKIDEDGEMTMLVRMRYDGYLSLFSTNNLWAKYAFLLSDQELSDAFGLTEKDDLVFLRAKMWVARFFPEAQQIINFVWNTFVQRIWNGQAIGDIADVFGKTIDELNLLAVTQQVIAAGNNPTKVTPIIDTLTQDERFVLAQYLGLYNLLRQNSPQFQQVLNQILGQSVTWSSQVIIFELK